MNITEGAGNESVPSGGSGRGAPGAADPTFVTWNTSGASCSRRAAPPDPGVVPLRRWIRDEARRRSREGRSSGPGDVVWIKQRSLLRKVVVAYGVAELLIHRRRNDNRKYDGDSNGNGDGNGSDIGSGKFNGDGNDNGDGKERNDDEGKEFGVDDFAVLVAPGDSSWMNVEGVRTTSLSSPLSVRLTEPFYVSNLLDENAPDRMGRYLEAEFSRGGDDGALVGPTESSSNDEGGDLGDNLRSFGALLYELCSEMPRLADDAAAGGGGDATRRSSERSTVRYDKRKGKSHATMSRTTYATLRELGHPSSLCRLTRDLADGRAEYPSLEAARDDLHLMLRDPDCFLFDAEDASPDAPSGDASGGGAKGLRMRRGKLYGREEEVAMITDAFCRVSSGEDAAFFVGGYS
ncbi:hypothetical protein ACHAWF_001985, partial [Thalassiosira exigua]